MSHCANYIIVLGGQRLTANTRWGANSLPADVFWGPDVTFDFVTSLVDEEDPDTTRLYDELMCEGAVFADYDAAWLLVWGGQDLAAERPLQLAYLDLLRAMWPGWRVDWARGGWAQVAAAAGVDVGPYRRGYVDLLRYAWSQGLDWAEGRLAAIAEDAGVAPRFGEGDRVEFTYVRRWEPETTRYMRKPDGQWGRVAAPDLWHQPVTDDDLYLDRGADRLVLVTVAGPDGVVDRPVGGEGPYVFAHGPAACGIAAGQPPVALTPSLHCAEAGLCVQPERQVVHYWMGRPEPSFLPDLFAAAWPGWTVRPNDAGITGHFTLTGRDPAPVRIDPTVLRRYVLRMLLNADRNRGIDEIVAQIAEQARKPGVIVAPGALRNPRPGLDADTRRQRLAALLEQPDG